MVDTDANEARSKRISISIIPAVLAKLDALAVKRRWTRSTAAAQLIEHGLIAPLGASALSRQEQLNLINAGPPKESEGRIVAPFLTPDQYRRLLDVLSVTAVNDSDQELFELLCKEWGYE